METMSKLSSPPHLGIPVLDPPDDTADHTLDDTLKNVMDTTAPAEDATYVILLGPLSLPTDAAVHP